MVKIIVAMCAMALAGLASAARADSSTTRPTLTVAVVPFDVRGESGREWLGRAMQEALATGLQRGSGISGVIVAGIAPADSAGAMAMAKSAGTGARADAVVFGGIQVVDGQIRIGGQILSMNTGKSLGVLRSDGSERDLFNLEDVLAARAQRILMPARPANDAVHANPSPQIELAGPTIGRGGSRYFDGNLLSQITPPARFGDDYDRYYYYSADTACCAPYGCGSGYSCGFGFGNGVLFPAAYPVSGW
jgi:TolB-like protein